MTLPLTVLGILKAECHLEGWQTTNSWTPASEFLIHGVRSGKERAHTSITSQVLLLLLPQNPHFENHHPAGHRNGRHKKQGRINRPGGWWRYAANPQFLKSDYLFFQVLRQPPILQDATFFLIVALQSLSRVQLSATLYTATRQASLSCTISQSLLKLMSIESVMHPTISSSASPSPPAFNLSQYQGLFQWVISSHQVAKYWNFSINPSNEYSRLISFRIWASLVAQRVKHLPAVLETWIRSLGWEDPLEKEMATHSSILAWRIPWTEEPGGATVHSVAKSQTWLSNFTFTFFSFRIYWFDLLEVQGTLKSLLQHHSLKVSVLWSSDFFMVLLSHPYLTTGETIALTTGTFVNKVMSCFLICCLHWS